MRASTPHTFRLHFAIIWFYDFLSLRSWFSLRKTSLISPFLKCCQVLGKLCLTVRSLSYFIITGRPTTPSPSSVGSPKSQRKCLGLLLYHIQAAGRWRCWWAIKESYKILINSIARKTKHINPIMETRGEQRKESLEGKGRLCIKAIQ